MQNFLIALLLLCSPIAFAQRCYQVSCGADGVCAVPASKSLARLPTGLRIDRFSGYLYDQHEALSNSNCEIVKKLPNGFSFDNRGWSVLGGIHLRGKIRLSGVLRYDPSPGGDYRMEIDKKLLNRGSFFNREFYDINLDVAGKKISKMAPLVLREAACWEVKAEIEVFGISIEKSEGCTVGTAADKVKIVRLHKFKTCKPFAN